MRVLVATNMYPTEAEPWFGSFVHEQVEDLRRAGVSVEVYAFDGRRHRSAYLVAARQIRQLTSSDGFDLVHAHYGLTGAAALAQRRLPVVTTFWGSDVGYVRWQRLVSWVVARRTTPVFVAKENAERLCVREATVIPSAVSTSLFRPLDRSQARRDLGWPMDIPIALFPGARNNIRKRFDLFANALNHARLHEPDIVGMTLEGLSRLQVVAAMNAADVLVMTSDWEGSPLAVKEALACNLPIVSVPVGDVPETVEGLRGCSVVDREPSALASALLHSIASGKPTELRERAIDRYSGESIAARLANLYRSILIGRHE